MHMHGPPLKGKLHLNAQEDYLKKLVSKQISGFLANSQSRY